MSAAIFPGQLAEQVGMGRALALRSPAARRVLEEAERELGGELCRVLFEGPPERLAEPFFAQSGVIVTSLMAFAALAEAGVASHATAGYSLGVIAALAAAGSLTVAEALAVVRVQIAAYEHHLAGFDGTMAAVTGLPAERLAACCLAASDARGSVEVGSFNSAAQFVVTGERRAVERLLAAVAGRALAVRRLAIRWPVHSSYMAPVAAELWSALPGVLQPRTPRVPVYSPLDGEPIETAGQVIEVLAREIAEPVRWDLAVQAMRRDGFSHFDECGPSTQLGRMVQWIDRRASVRWVGEGIAAERAERSA